MSLFLLLIRLYPFHPRIPLVIYSSNGISSCFQFIYNSLHCFYLCLLYNQNQFYISLFLFLLNFNSISIQRIHSCLDAFLSIPMRCVCLFIQISFSVHNRLYSTLLLYHSCLSFVRRGFPFFTIFLRFSTQSEKKIVNFGVLLFFSLFHNFSLMVTDHDCNDSVSVECFSLLVLRRG